MNRLYLLLFLGILFTGCSKKSDTPAVTPTEPGLQTEVYSASFATNGNSYDTASIPKFDVAKGTLQSVSVKLTVSLLFTMALENNESFPFNYDIKIGREDIIKVDLLPVVLHDSVVNDYPYNLAASDGITGSGPDFVQTNNLAVLQNYTVSDSSYFPAFFNGQGNLPLYHQSQTFGYSQNGVNYTLRGSATDAFTITVTYTYKPQLLKPI